MALWNFRLFYLVYNETLSARYLENYLSWGLDIWYTYWGWGVDYLLGKFLKILTEIRPFAIFGNVLHWNLVSKIHVSQKLFELGPWYLVHLINFRGNSVKFYRSYGAGNFWHKILLMLGASICWGHSVLQTLALVLCSFQIYMFNIW